MKVVRVGLALTAVAALISWLVWGPEAILAAGAAGVVATLIELWAVARLRRGMTGTTAEFFAGFVSGVVLRLAGVSLMAVAVVALPGWFPPLPTAFTFLLVLVPLLLSEVRFAR